jgi:phosphohistidine phosphatase SixA
VEKGAAPSTDEVALRRVYFIRHAKAQDREVWHHPDELRPLTESGYRQADQIARALGGAHIGRVISSRAFRCVDTVWPLAEALDVRVQRHDALFEGASARRALALMSRLRETRVALCTHGDVMQAVLAELRDRGLDLSGGMRLAKGAYWVFDLDRKGQVTRASYRGVPGRG